MLFLCAAREGARLEETDSATTLTFTLPQALSNPNKHAHTGILNSFEFSSSDVFCCTLLSSRQLSLFGLLSGFGEAVFLFLAPPPYLKNRTWMTKRYEMRTHAAIFSFTGMWGCNWSKCARLTFNCLNYQKWVSCDDMLFMSGLFGKYFL